MNISFRIAFQNIRLSHPPSTEPGPIPCGDLVLRERECVKFVEYVTAAEVGIASSLSFIIETTELPRGKVEFKRRNQLIQSQRK